VFVSPAPAAATQMAQSMPAANVSSGNVAAGRPVGAAPVYGHAAGSVPRASQPRASGGVRMSSIGIAGAVVALLCIGMVALLGILISNEQRQSQQTADAQLQATLNERVRTTSTAQAEATQTASVFAQATEQARATVDARDAYLASLDSSKTLVFGPAAGNLTHKPDDGLIESYFSEVDLRDFIVEARFFNPYAASANTWDYGFLLRSIADEANSEFRFTIFSNATWRLLNSTGDTDQTQRIAEGILPGLKVNEKESNLVRLIFQGERGWFYLNHEFVAELDLSSRMNAGDIILSTGIFEDDEVAGYATGYSEFSIWSLP
jgi:hypothetical protein